MSKLKPLKIVVNAGNGAAGPILDVMEKYLPFELVKIHHQPLARIEEEYGANGKITRVDGLSVEYDNWRFNMRKSNTEPVIRLNVETRQDEDLMKEKMAELLAFMLPRG